MPPVTQEVVGREQVTARLAGIPQDGEVLGTSRAPVRVTEFVDLRCPACGRFSRTQLDRVIDRAVRPGVASLRRRVVVATVPRDRAAQAALVAQGTVPQDRFWRYTELWLENLPVIEGQETGAVAPALLEAAGVRERPFEAAMADPGALQAQIDAAREDMDRAGATVLPAFLIEREGRRARLIQAPTAPELLRVIEDMRR